MSRHASLGEYVKGIVKVEVIRGFGRCLRYATLDHVTDRRPWLIGSVYHARLGVKGGTGSVQVKQSLTWRSTVPGHVFFVHGHTFHWRTHTGALCDAWNARFQLSAENSRHTLFRWLMARHYLQRVFQMDGPSGARDIIRPTTFVKVDVTGHQVMSFGHFSFGPLSDNTRTLTDRWTRSGENLTLVSGLPYMGSEQDRLVFCFTSHDSHQLTGSRPCLVSSDVHVHVEVGVVCLQSMSVERSGHHYAVSHVPTGPSTFVGAIVRFKVAFSVRCAL